VGKGWKKASMLDVAAKKGKIFTKLAREIYVAAKLGGPDPEGNPRLKTAIRAALDVSCPKTTIDRAIQKATGGGDGESYEEVTYEGQGPYNVGIIVECQTDNRNRTVTNIKNAFNKNGGKMGDKGSSSWMFDRVSLIEGKIEKEIDAEEEAIEAGANDVEFSEEENKYSFYGAPEDLDVIRTALTERGWSISTAELSYKSKNPTDISEEQRQEVVKLLEALDDDDDSHRIYVTI
jgi:YebC/PmpR family DNA-binding regulatory protein